MKIPVSDLPQTADEAVDQLYADISLNDEILLASTSEDNLIDAYLALGHQIRHEFGLWTDNSALLESCRILSGNRNLQVDDASMVIIRALWERYKSQICLKTINDYWKLQ